MPSKPLWQSCLLGLQHLFKYYCKRHNYSISPFVFCGVPDRKFMLNLIFPQKVSNLLLQKCILFSSLVQRFVQFALWLMDLLLSWPSVHNHLIGTQKKTPPAQPLASFYRCVFSLVGGWGGLLACRVTLGIFRPAARLLCSTSGTNLIQMLDSPLWFVYVHTATFKSSPAAVNKCYARASCFLIGQKIIQKKILFAPYSLFSSLKSTSSCFTNSFHCD